MSDKKTTSESASDVIEILIGMLFLGLWYGVCWVFKSLFHLTPYGKKRLRAKEEQKRAEEQARKRLSEEREKRQRQLEQEGILRYCRALWKLDYDMVIVDTNTFMGVVQESESTGSCTSVQFFNAIRMLKVKVHILPSLLNELANMNKRDKDNKKQKHKVRAAKREIESLQNEKLLEIVGDVNSKLSYADREIINVCRRLVRSGRKPLVITGDRDLRIRLGSENVLRKSVADLFELGADNVVNLRGVHCGGEYICMDKTRGGVLIANRDRAELWETFSLVAEDRAVYTLQSKANNKFVCADATQGGRLVAREATSDDQTAFEFELVPVAGKKSCIALKSKATGKFVSVRENEGNVLIASAPEVSDWEILEIC